MQESRFSVKRDELLFARRGTGILKTKHVFQVIVEQDETGLFVAECPSLKACYTQGKTYEEVIENIKDVIGLCLEDYKARRQKVPLQPEIIGIKRLEIAV